MDKKQIYKEVRSDFKDGNFTCIDAWLTDDGNEEGKVIAVVHDSGDVYYIEPEARFCCLAQEVITNTLNRLKK